MHPEETLVPSLSIPFANRPTRVLIQEFADHSLCNRMENSRVGPRRSWIGFTILRVATDSWRGMCGPRLGPRRVIVIVR